MHDNAHLVFQKTTFPHKILRVKRITGKVKFSDETTGARGTDHPPFF